MESIDPFLGRMPGPGYNCLNFAREVSTELFGDDVRQRLDMLCSGIHGKGGRVMIGAVRGFEKLQTPVSPCFVVMRRSKLQPHVGIFYNGRILHLKETGVEYQPLRVARRYFTTIGFYR